MVNIKHVVQPSSANVKLIFIRGRTDAPAWIWSILMIKKEKIKDLHYSLTGLISVSEINSAADEILAEHGKKTKIAGFREGHIPLSVLRQKFGASAKGEAIDKLMNADLEKFVADKKIRLAGSPNADVAKFTDWRRCGIYFGI